MITVRELLETKGGVVLTIAPADSVFDAIKTMADKSVGALVVMDGADLVGIITERDYARKVVLKGRSSKKTACRNIMTGDVLVVSPDRTLDEYYAWINQSWSTIPFLDGNDRLVGLISIGDCIKAIVSKQEFIIEQLESYIRSG